jgi:hypothetical protein
MLAMLLGRSALCGAEQRIAYVNELGAKIGEDGVADGLCAVLRTARDEEEKYAAYCALASPVHILVSTVEALQEFARHSANAPIIERARAERGIYLPSLCGDC